MNACTHTHTHLTHMLDINIYVGVVEAKQGKELRECQGRGGNCSLIKSSQITFEANAKKKKNRVSNSNYRKPGGNTFQELKLISVLKNYRSGM